MAGSVGIRTGSGLSGLGWKIRLENRPSPSYLVVHNKLIWDAVRYTPSQVRQVVGITQETLRHWRSSLPSLSGLKGHAPVFRPGQLLGLAVVRTLVEDLGLSIRSLKTAERTIFEVCSSPQWVRLARGYLLIRPADGSAQFVDKIADGDVDRASIVLPMERIVTLLREALLEVTPEDVQQSIPFPPVGVAERRPAANRGRP